MSAKGLTSDFILQLAFDTCKTFGLIIESLEEVWCVGCSETISCWFLIVSLQTEDASESADTVFHSQRNEMSETPLIREAADGNKLNVWLLLEAGADIEAQQEHKIGFTALTSAVCPARDTCRPRPAHALLQPRKEKSG